MNDLVFFEQFARGKKAQTVRSSNCVIYTRVSTKEQADNNMSLETQKRACEQFASKQGYNIIGYFGGTYESAKTDERKAFNSMLAYVKKCKEKVSYIIVYSVDRFSRSGANAIYITEQLKRGGITVQSVTQPTDATTASGSLQQNIQFIFSEYDNQLRREKCMAGVRDALLRGEWVSKPPIGYSTIRENGKRKIVVNQTGKLLRKAFLWKANEKVSNEEARLRLNALGLKLPDQRISDIFRNPFYCGLLVHNSLEGQVLEGKHEKLVSNEVFLKVNEVQAANPHGYKMTVENESISLKRFIRCEKCGKHMTGYLAHKNQKFYYKCRTKGCGVNKRADDLHPQFTKLLEDYTIPLSEGLTHFIKKYTIEAFKKLNEQKEVDTVTMEKQVEELGRKLNRLEERFIEEELTKEMYLKYSEKAKEERREIERQLAKSKNGCSNLENVIESALDFASKFKPLWDLSDYWDKQKLQFMLFPEGIYYDKKKDAVRTARVNSVFLYMRRLARLSEKKKSGEGKPNLHFPASVEDNGVEPMTSCMPCKRSSQLS
ncbi:recombinase family protein [Flavisolibacter ginsenosidimutans]